MHKLLETIRSAKSFSEIYPELKVWKKAIENHFVFVSFDQMREFTFMYLTNNLQVLDFDFHIFSDACDLVVK